MKIRIMCLAALAACAASAAAGNYKVTVNLTPDEDGAMAFLVNYDNGKKIDSVMVDEGKAVFSGTLDAPVMARLTLDGKRSDVFFIEDGDITFDPAKNTATGGALNGKMNDINAHVNEIVAKYKAAMQAKDEAAAEAAYNEYQAYVQQQAMANIDNLLGLSLFLDTAYGMEPNELKKVVDEHPALMNSKRVQKLIAANNAKLATQAGAKFTDFEVTYDGKTHRLSDVVGKGTPVLVDFWASWCGPCRREMPNLKAIHDKYGDRLKVLGVAVWDEPDDSFAAVKELGLPWEVWVNGQTAPTDAYGISGIPCIVVFNGDGTIAFRDLVGEDLSAALTKLLGE